jgi:phage terminase large subunit-like protein
MYSPDKANRAIKFIELLKHTKSPFFGVPFDLLPWQRSIVNDVYGTVNERGIRQYRYAYLELPKKNGKSEICAALALFHLFADGEKNGEVYGCASDREQASLVFDVAVDMIDQIPSLRKRTKFNASTKMISDKKSGTTYKVMSSEAYTKHGINLSACVFDELHSLPSRDLWDVMTKGAGDARTQPLWWVITTAGSDPDRVTIGWEVHEKAESIIIARETGDVSKDIPTWYPVIYGYQGEDIFNESNWAKANPSMGFTFDVDKLREASAEAKQSKADERLFRWLRLNQWVTTKLTGWLPVDLFDNAIGSWARNDLLGKDCYIGLDLSTTTDLSAIALLFPPQDGLADWRVIWDCWIPEENMAERIRSDHVPYDKWAADGWVYPTAGNVVDYTVIKDRILECAKLYNVIEVDADKSFASMLIQELEQEKLVCVDIPQTYVTLTDPMNMIEILLRGKSQPAVSLQVGENNLEEEVVVVEKTDQPALAVGSGVLTHEDNPVARWCFGNTSIAKNGNAQIKYVKQRRGKHLDRSKRIDLVAAWVCAMSRAKYYGNSKSVYEKRGIRTLG